MTVHLWLGLSSGLVVIAICLSGTIYVWNTELTEWSAPQLYTVNVPAGAPRIPADSLKQKVSSTTGGMVTAVTIPASDARTYQFQVKKKGDSTRGVTYYVNPYTGEITGNSLQKTRTQKFMSTMFSLHRWLLLDKLGNRELGSAITGSATIIFTLGCITGLIIWFPRKLRNWKQGLKIKFNSNWKRLNHDLHNTLAFYALFFLLLMGLTGPQWSFPWYREGLQKTLGTYKPPAPKGGDKKEKKKDKAEVALLSIGEYKTVADGVLSYNGDYVITFPSENSSSVMVSKYKLGFFAPAAADRLTLDAATASVQKTDIFWNKPFNERVAGSIKAIHVGNVYGTFTKIIYFVACLIATTLPITGTMIWLNKLKQRRRKKVVDRKEVELVSA
ncbi:MAG TPA: PepSY-associated TM helix domain-containing protein [Chitinophagaceae bacterium]|nr:PepSY-associated TM helix domain-containing protein [Chitinophagaceae bacterium]